MKALNHRLKQLSSKKPSYSKHYLEVPENVRIDLGIDEDVKKFALIHDGGKLYLQVETSLIKMEHGEWKALKKKGVKVKKPFVRRGNETRKDKAA